MFEQSAIAEITCSNRATKGKVFTGLNCLGPGEAVAPRTRRAGYILSYQQNLVSMWCWFSWLFNSYRAESLVPRFQIKPDEARQCVAGSDFLQGRPEKPLHEAVNVKPRFKWTQNVGSNRNVESLSARDTAGTK